MEIPNCLCGSFATHRCLGCKPSSFLCLDCVEDHLSVRPEDGLISLKLLEAQQDFSLKCWICSRSGPEHLEVTENSAKPVCKKCKKQQKKQNNTNFSEILVPVKWKEIVFSTSDLKEIGFRRHIAKLAYEEVESLNHLFDDSYLEEIQQSIGQVVSRLIQKKKEEIKKVKIMQNDEILKIKKGIDEEVLKEQPDLNSDAGKIVSLLMKSSSSRTVSKKKFIPSSDFLDSVEKMIDRVLFNNRAVEHLIYFFNPGRPSIWRINLEKMEKKDLVFERNWTFEASWCELSNRNLFFCGGNGPNSSEVLLINPTTLSVMKKQSFSGRSGHALVEIDDFVFVFGGNRGKIVEKFNHHANEWEALADLPYNITRTAACLVNQLVVLTGNDCLSIFGYNVCLNTYSDLGQSLEAFRTKNKIIFFHQGKIFCITGNKVLHCQVESFGNWQSADIVDKDWWTYCKPVVYNNCAFFIKFFVRNLWKLDLKTFKIEEINSSYMVDAN